jgi:hypothetical protein
LILDKKNITFSWEKDEEIQTSVLTISKNKDFNSTLFSEESPNNFIQFENKLDPGTYYWRVRGASKDGEQTPYSQSRSFKIITSGEIALMRPRDGETLSSAAEARGSQINFSWSPLDINGTFTLKVSRDKSLKNLIVDEKTQDFYLVKDIVNDGTYFWQVFLHDEDSIELMKSKVRRFVLLNKLTTPSIISPANGDTVDMLNKKTLGFSWKKVSGASHYKFSLFQKKGGSLQWITDIETESTSCEIGDLNKLDVGSFYWTLQGLEKDKKTNKIIRKSSIKKNNFFIKLGSKKKKIKIPDVIYVN